MSENRPNDEGLEAFFEAARATAPKPGAALEARILADAAALQPRPPISQPKRRWFGALGGWPAVAGLVTATVAGVSIGVADPATVGDIAFSGFGDAYDFSAVGSALDLGLEEDG